MENKRELIFDISIQFYKFYILSIFQKYYYEIWISGGLQWTVLQPTCCCSHHYETVTTQLITVLPDIQITYKFII